jgi:Tfp pilus assembly pilus retraction ATPase PilT
MTFFKSLIRVARAQGASDLHLISGLPPAIRVHGDIVMMDMESLSREQVREISLSILTESQRNVLAEQYELCFSILDEETGRVRVTVYYHGGVPELSIRLGNTKITDAGDLGLPPIVATWPPNPTGWC